MDCNEHRLTQLLTKWLFVCTRAKPLTYTRISKRAAFVHSIWRSFFFHKTSSSFTKHFLRLHFVTVSWLVIYRLENKLVKPFLQETQKKSDRSCHTNKQSGKHPIRFFCVCVCVCAAKQWLWQEKKANSTNLSAMTSGSKSTSNKAVKIHQAAHLSDCIVKLAYVVRVHHNRIDDQATAMQWILWIEAELY